MATVSCYLPRKWAASFIVARAISMSARGFDETLREGNLILDGHETRGTF